MSLLFEPMFRVPFITGLLLVLLLPQLGLLLRLRHEWLAALGFAHLAGAGGALGALLGLPALLSGLALAFAGVLARALVPGRGNDFHALMILLGWSTMVLAMALSQHAHGLGRLLIDGQLYFTHRPHLVAVAIFAVLMLALLPALMRTLLRAELLPRQDLLNREGLTGAATLFNLLLAAGVALSAMVMGVMAAFALLFVPAWVAWRLAPGWRVARWLASLLALGCYLAAFVLALLADLPFGPVLVAMLVLVSVVALLAPERTAQAQSEDCHQHGADQQAD